MTALSIFNAIIYKAQYSPSSAFSPPKNRTGAIQRPYPLPALFIKTNGELSSSSFLPIPLLLFHFYLPYRCGQRGIDARR